MNASKSTINDIFKCVVKDSVIFVKIKLII